MRSKLPLAPSPQLLSFAQRHVANATSDAPKVDRRSQPRQLIASPTVVQEVDCELTPLGDPVAAVTSDLSLDGVGLIFEALPIHKLLTVQFAVEGQSCHLLVEVLRKRPMGPFEHMGCRVLKVL